MNEEDWEVFEYDVQDMETMVTDLLDDYLDLPREMRDQLNKIHGEIQKLESQMKDERND